MILPKLLMRCWGPLGGCIMCKKDNHEASRRFTAKNLNRVRLLAVPFLLRRIYPVQDCDAVMQGCELHNEPMSRRSRLHLTRSTEASEAEWSDDRIASSSGGVTELARLYHWKGLRIAEGSASRMRIIGLRSLYTGLCTWPMDRSVNKTADKVSINLATSRNKRRELVKVDYSSWSARPTVVVHPSQYPTQRLYKTSTDLTCRSGPAQVD